jgi:biopolymer transport protein ExbD
MRWENDARISFIPFLDILVAAIGIFLLIIALQKISDRVETSPPQADAVVIVGADSRLTWLDLEENTKIDIPRYQIVQYVETLAKRLEKPINVIVAFSAENIEAMYHVSDNLNYLKDSVKLKDDNINFRVIWWPLSSQADAVEDFLSSWGGEP